jgi:hypothetical protein
MGREAEVFFPQTAHLRYEDRLIEPERPEQEELRAYQRRENQVHF